MPAGRLRALARYGLAAKAQTLRRLSPDRRTATLLAALWQLELDATDDALILLDQVTGLLLSHAAREHKDRRYAQLPDLDRAARRLRAAVLVLLDPPPGGIEELWSAIGRHVSRAELELAAATVHQLASQPDSTTARTPRSAVSCCAATRASDASCRPCSRPSPSTPPRPAGRSSMPLSRCGPWKAGPAASAPARCR